jgi:hypothetical protein
MKTLTKLIFVLTLLTWSADASSWNLIKNKLKMDFKTEKLVALDTNILISKTFSEFDLFLKDTMNLKKDTFEFFEATTEGGQAIVYHSDQSKYVLIDMWIFGEMGKANYKYFLTQNMKMILAQNITYTYDKPMYERGYKISKTMEYEIFKDEFVIAILDSNKNIIPKTKDQLKQRHKDSGYIFKTYLSQLKVLK